MIVDGYGTYRVYNVSTRMRQGDGACIGVSQCVGGKKKHLVRGPEGRISSAAALLQVAATTITASASTSISPAPTTPPLTTSSSSSSTSTRPARQDADDGRMALKRRDALLAAAAVFIAWGYLTHYSPSLRILPYAIFAGAIATVALQAWCMLTTSFDRAGRSRRRFNYGARHVAFLAPDRWRAERDALTTRSTYIMEPLYPASFVISDSLDVLLGLMLRDFVKSWYGSISKSPTFVNEVDRALRAALGDIRDRLLQSDLVDVAVSRMVPLVTDHLRAAYEAERLVRGRKLSRNVTESEELDLAIAAKYNEGRLHPAASLAYSNTKLVQQQYLRSIVARLLPRIMPQNMTTSPAVNVLIKEIVACAVLSPVMQMLADPDTWNQMMEGYASPIHPAVHSRLMSLGSIAFARTKDSQEAARRAGQARSAPAQKPKEPAIPQTGPRRQRAEV